MHDSSARYPPPLCHPNTCQKVLKIITDWIDRHCIMWLNGHAGAGKSAIAQTICVVVKVFKNLLRDNPGLRPEKSLVIIEGVDECASEQNQKLVLTLIADALARPLRQ